MRAEDWFTIYRISIHTPHAGSDLFIRIVPKRHYYFNPHSPCGERPLLQVCVSPSTQFQSTLPMRGATPGVRKGYFCAGFQSTLPMRGATRSRSPGQPRCRYFNPHSPCGERHLRLVAECNRDRFQSTLPMRGATQVMQQMQQTMAISIHTPHAGSDPRLERTRSMTGDFNPHSPCGERQAWRAAASDGVSFQSTLPMRGATGGAWLHD